jgi:hypothetical protein
LRIVRETVGERKPQLRVASEWPQADDEREVYYLTLQASIGDFPVLGNDTAKTFAAIGIHTVEDLLKASADRVAEQLKRPAISAATVRLWQAHMSLMCFVPGVSLNDAQVLAANEVQSPEALFAADMRLVVAEIDRFFSTERGRRFASLRSRFTRDRLVELQKLARTQRDRWQRVCAGFSRTDRPALAPITPTRAAKVRTKPATVAALNAEQRTPRKPLEFLLDRTSPVAQAPSIDAAAAEQLAKVGVRTVADLLNANPEAAAEEIGEPQVTAALISRWQSEARLACRIPELRCSGAQLLVASGFTEPEQVAGADAAELFRKVRDVCRSPKGKRLLREGKAPSRERIAQWIRHAAHMRPLEAA